MKVRYIYKDKKTKIIKFSNKPLNNEDYNLVDVLGYTGETSIYGEEIYEGDIVKDQNGYIYYIAFSNTVCNGISFHTLCLFNVLNISKTPLLINNNEDKFEIIGNKYDKICPSMKRDIIEFAKTFIEPDDICRCDLHDKIKKGINTLYVFDTTYVIDYDVLTSIEKGNLLIITDSKIEDRLKEYIRTNKGVLTLETSYNKIYMINVWK